MKKVARLRFAVAAMLALGAFAPRQVLAQVPPRFYWKTLSNANAVPLIGESLSGNTNPFDPSHMVNAGGNVSATLLLAGYARTFTLFNRSAMVALIAPMGRVSGEVTAAGKSFNQASQGFGDPMIEFDFNLLGPKAQKNIPDILRYEPKFSLDVLTDLAFPIGEYNSSQPLNLGQHRWYGRVGAPVLWQLGRWAPGRRTTIEALPVVWWFGPNNNFVGQTMKTAPMFQVDGHLTRDLTGNFWASVDATWFYGGKATINGATGKNLNNAGIGFTAGYQINDNLGLTVGYKSTVHDKGPTDMRMDRFMISLVVGWHPLIEGSKRLKRDSRQFQPPGRLPHEECKAVEMKQVSDSCFAVLNEKNRVCDANSGLINRGGGVVVDTQSDLSHARQMIEMFSKVWTKMPRRVVNTHEDGDHVWGNQLFEGAEIIAHRSVPERMRDVANPRETQRLLHGVGRLLTRLLLKALHPGILAAGQQLRQEYNFDGIELALPGTLFETRYELDLDGVEVHLIYVGPCHQVGDTIIHVPRERIVFAGDVLFRQCTPMGWTGSYEKWLQCLDLIVQLDPAVIVPGHGPLCGIEGVVEMREYLNYVRDESKKCFDAGLTSLDAAKRIEFGPYGEWRAPARLYMNVERAYRELRNEPTDAPWDTAGTFDAIYKVARAKGIRVEY